MSLHSFTCFSDFTVKLVTVQDNSQKVVIQHEAPVMCVSINPQETLLVNCLSLLK